METRVLVAICLVVVLVIGVNGVLYFMFRSARNTQHIQMWQKAANRARDPWKKENQALQELSKRVADLKSERENGENED